MALGADGRLLPALGAGAHCADGRLLLFDPALNLAAGDKVFAVGSTARFDKAVRWRAAKLGMEPEHLRFLLWLASIAGAIICWLIAH